MLLLIWNNFNLYLLFTNFLLVVLFYKSMKQNEIRTGLFFILFFFAARLYLQYNFILLRQAIAMTIIWMWAFPFLLRKEKIKFLLCLICLAAAFHYTALICIAGISNESQSECKIYNNCYLLFLYFKYN